MEYTAYVTKVGAWYVATCEQVSEASARGRTPEACLKNLRIALTQVLKDRKGSGPGSGTSAGTGVPPVVIRRTGRVDRIA